MQLLKNNISFAIIDTEQGWRTDLTSRYCDFFAQKLHEDSFQKFIFIAKNIDNAIELCKTKYLLVQQSGHITFNDVFFTKIEDVIAADRDIFLGHIILSDDYAVIDSSCVFINVELWKEHGEPSFSAGKQKDGPKFAVSQPSQDKNKPLEIVVIPGADREFVPSSCGPRGAAAVIKQLDTFQRSTSLSMILDDRDFHFFDHSTSLGEIRAETSFEKKYIPLIKSRIFSADPDTHEKMPNTIADVVCAPARGLKALNLAEQYRAQSVVVFDENPIALELQKMIFGVQKPTTYGEIVAEFLTEYPHANIGDEWYPDKYSVITPYKGEVQYKIVDLFSYEAEELIKDIDHSKILVIDFSNQFVDPYNFYRKPLYQVQGLFAELYSLLKSRTGPTHILGYSPGFRPMDEIEINTSTVKYEVDATIDPRKPGDDGIQPPEPEPLVFEPQTSPQVIQKLDPKPPIVKRIMNAVKSISSNPIAIAGDIGYVKSTANIILAGSEKEVTLLSKREILNDMIFVFEYGVDEASGEWCFRVGMDDSDKRIELSNGANSDRFKKHLLNDFKINPNTIKKFFGK